MFKDPCGKIYCSPGLCWLHKNHLGSSLKIQIRTYPQKHIIKKHLNTHSYDFAMESLDRRFTQFHPVILTLEIWTLEDQEKTYRSQGLCMIFN